MASPARSRSVVIGGTAAVCALLGGGLGLAVTANHTPTRRTTQTATPTFLATTTAADPSTTATPTTGPTPMGGPTSEPGAGSTVRVTVTTGPPPAPVVAAPPGLPAPEGLGDPAVTARRFATEYWTWRWNEPDSAPLTRARPYITDTLAASWAQSSSAAAAVAQRRARHVVETPAFTDIYQDPEQAGLWHIHGTTTTTADGAAPASRPLDGTLIVVDRVGWRVDTVTDNG